MQCTGNRSILVTRNAICVNAVEVYDAYVAISRSKMSQKGSRCSYFVASASQKLEILLLSPSQKSIYVKQPDGAPYVGEFCSLGELSKNVNNCFKCRNIWRTRPRRHVTLRRRHLPRPLDVQHRRRRLPQADILFLKHDSSIFRQSSDPVCGSWKNQVSYL